MQTTYRSHPGLAKAVVPDSELSPEGSLFKQSLNPEGSHRVQIPRTCLAVEHVDVDSRWLLETVAARSLLLLEPTTRAFSPRRRTQPALLICVTTCPDPAKPCQATCPPASHCTCPRLPPLCLCPTAPGGRALCV